MKRIKAAHKSLANKKKYEEALSFIEKAILLSPTSSSVYYEKALILEALGKQILALEECHRALQLDPLNADYYGKRGQLWFATQNLDHAFADYNKALDLNSAFAEIYIERAYLFYLQKDFPKALNDYHQGIALQPQNANFYYLRGLVLEELQQEFEAQLNYQKALELEEGNPYAFQKLLALYLKNKKTSEALTLIEKALALPTLKDSNLPQLFIHLTLDFLEELQEKGNPEDLFQKTLQRYEKQKQKSTLPLDELCVLRAKKKQMAKDLSGALRDLELALKLNPESEETYALLAFIKEKHYNQRSEALFYYTKALERAPQRHDFYKERGRLQTLQKNYPAALADLQKALELEKEDAFVYFNLGILYKDWKEEEKAIEAFQQGLDRQNHQEIATLFSELLWNQILLHYRKKESASCKRYVLLFQQYAPPTHPKREQLEKIKPQLEALFSEEEEENPK